MNDSELKFYNWLINKRGIKKEDIHYTTFGSPDFVVKIENQEIGYEVKTIYFNVVHLHYSQHLQIKNSNRETYIALMKHGFIDEPIAMIPYEKIKDKSTQKVGNYKVYIALFKKGDISARKEILDVWKELVLRNRETEYERLNKLLLKDIKRLDRIEKEKYGKSVVEDWKKNALWYGDNYLKEFNRIFKNYPNRQEKDDINKSIEPGIKIELEKAK